MSILSTKSNGFTDLANVKPFKTGWRIRVKVLHSWKQYTSQSGETLEMVLADNTAKIHATCKKMFVTAIEKHLPVGEWRVIENFSLSPAYGQYRTTNHQYKLGFQNHTSVTRTQYQSNDIFLSITDFQTIFSGTLKNCFLIDVLGQVVDVGEVQTLQCNGKERKKLEFSLRDSQDQRLPCCLWGRFAEQVMASCLAAGENMVICLIRFSKINYYKGDLQITNAFDASQVLLNAALPEFNQFKKSLPNDGISLNIMDPNDEKDGLDAAIQWWSQFEKKTISQMLSTNEIGKCRVFCTIYAIDSDWSWYYWGCKKCNRKVFPPKVEFKTAISRISTPFFWCALCEEHVTNVTAKFWLHLMVMDHTDKTKFMLLDFIAQDIVPQSAADIVGPSFEEVEDPTILPEAISNLIGKTFEFLVCIEKDNVTHGNEYYKIGKVWTGNDVLKIDETANPDTPTITLGTIVSADEVSNVGLLSEESSDAVTTPSSKREGGELEDICDLTSTNKKTCFKKIKLEKLSDDGKKKDKVTA